MTRKNPLLVTGGAGHVGSHVLLAFRDAGYPGSVAPAARRSRSPAIDGLPRDPGAPMRRSDEFGSPLRRASPVRRQPTDCRGARVPR